MRDLWPEDFGHISELKAPVTILKEQASLLGKKTSNLVEAEVVQYSSPTPGKFDYTFYIVAPVLDNYKYKLFTISHGIDSYPVTIYVGEDMQAEIDLAEIDLTEPREKLVAESESEFVEVLKKIFSTEKTKRAIGTLLSMASEEEIQF